MAAPEPGDRVGPYVVERELGRGGMGAVYLARHETLRREVALKVLAANLTGDERFRERFEREARLAARMNHPHVVPVYDAGVADAGPWMTMRFVRGEDLQARVRAEGGVLEPERAVALVHEIATALDHAHLLGVVHRDVKPANVLLEPTETGERALLGDFGLTKELDAHEDEDLTETGRLLGTVDYMAPEQVEAERSVDGRADVYALTAMLVMLLTGEPPFRGTPVAKLVAHVHEPPPAPGERFADLAPFDAVVRAGMAKDPGARPATAGALADMAERALAAVPPPELRAPRPVVGPAADEATASMSDDVGSSGLAPPPRRRRGLAAAGVLLAVALLAAAGWALTRDAAPATGELATTVDDGVDGRDRVLSCRVPAAGPAAPRPRTAQARAANRTPASLRDVLGGRSPGRPAPGLGCAAPTTRTVNIGEPDEQEVRSWVLLAADRRWAIEMPFTVGPDRASRRRPPVPRVYAAADGALVRVVQRLDDRALYVVDHGVAGGGAFALDAAERRVSDEYRGPPVWTFTNGPGLPCPKRLCGVAVVDVPQTGESWRIVLAGDRSVDDTVNLLAIRAGELARGFRSAKTIR